jgi:hypothetical protein
MRTAVSETWEQPPQRWFNILERRQMLKRLPETAGPKVPQRFVEADEQSLQSAVRRFRFSTQGAS